MIAAALGCFGWSAGATLGQPSEGPSGAQRGAIITIRHEITDVTVESVKRRIERARNDGAQVLVFELDTPGGLVTSSIAIADHIKTLNGVNPEVKTVAWVNTNAHSGGSIVAVAADEIVMARSSRMGDSQVIMGGPGGVGAVPEELQPKAYTPVLSEFRASARLNGYSQVLCEAFVLPEREVWWLEHVPTGRREFVFREEKIKRLGEDDDSGGGSDGSGKDSKNTSDDETRKSESTVPRLNDGQPWLTGALGRMGRLVLNGLIEPDGRIAQGNLLDRVSPSDSEVAKEGSGEWKLVERYDDPILDMEVDAIQPIVADNQLLEMSAAEAYAYGFCKAIVTTEQDLIARYGLTSVTRYAPTWSEDLAFWLTSVYVRGFLLCVIFLGLYVEFHTPGVGVPGLAALIGLLIFVAAPYLTGLANVWEVLLILVGLVLVLLEFLVIPGFGIPGILGLIFLLTGLVFTFVPDEPGRLFPFSWPSLPGTMHSLKVAVTAVVSAMGASLVGIILLGRVLPRTLLFRRIVPANPTPSEVQIDDPYRGAALVGMPGVVESALHPAGKARFGGTLVDVVTQGEFIGPGTRVEVIERRGNLVVVRTIRDQSGAG